MVIGCDKTGLAAQNKTKNKTNNPTTETHTFLMASSFFSGLAFGFSFPGQDFKKYLVFGLQLQGAVPPGHYFATFRQVPWHG
jgi:hypothetical protein